MNFKIFLISVIFATLFVFSVGVSAKDFDVTDISYSYVGYGYPAYGPAYGPVGGYVDPYTGVIINSNYYPITYYPTPYYQTNYYPVTYYPTTYYPTVYYSGYNYNYGYGYYNNSISYSDNDSSITFSWMR